MTRLAERLGKDLLEIVWKAAKEVNDDGLSPDTARDALLDAVQQRLMKTHATLLVVNIGAKRRRNASEHNCNAKVPRRWQPTRPQLSRGNHGNDRPRGQNEPCAGFGESI